MSLSARIRRLFSEEPVVRERPVERLRNLAVAEEEAAIRAERIVPDLRSERFQRDLARVAEGDRGLATELRAQIARLGLAGPPPVRDTAAVDGSTFQRLSVLAEHEGEIAREALSLASIEEDETLREVLERAGDAHRTNGTEIALAASLIGSFVR
ncbi:MAG: hypothetical protein IPK07_21805 [Deltaproteobacteria bacterium]|nr:hypothetical protein [Deltaproteobacteria bacterium]